jgi:hypothetical protein
VLLELLVELEPVLELGVVLEAVVVAGVLDPPPPPPPPHPANKASVPESTTSVIVCFIPFFIAFFPLGFGLLYLFAE